MAKKKGSANKSRNMATIRAVLKDEGFSAYAIAASLARMSAESRFDPKAINPNDAGKGNHSRGILQWNRDRLTNLQNFARKSGKDWQDVETQARFYAAEVKGKIGGEGKWGKKLLAASSADEAAKAGISLARPGGWTAKNPERGLGYKETLKNTKAFLKGSSSGLADSEGDVSLTGAKSEFTDGGLTEIESMMSDGRKDKDRSVKNLDDGSKDTTGSGEGYDPYAIDLSDAESEGGDQGVLDFSVEDDSSPDERYGGGIMQMLAGLAVGLGSADIKKNQAPTPPNNGMYDAARREGLGAISLDQIKSMIRV